MASGQASVACNASTIQSRYDPLKWPQKKVLDAIVSALKERQMVHDRLIPPGKVLVIHSAAETGNTYLVNSLRVCKSKEMLVEITATTGEVVSLYKDHTLHSLLGLGAGEKDSNTAHALLLSKYGPRSQWAELLRHLPLLVLDEVSMIFNELSS